MSVLTRTHTIPGQRKAERVLDLDAPRLPMPPARRSTRGPALMLAGGVLVVAAAAGTTAYLAADDDTAGTSSTVSVPAGTDAQRDAALSSRVGVGTTSGGAGPGSSTDRLQTGVQAPPINGARPAP
jgi:hypothetical protein